MIIPPPPPTTIINVCNTELEIRDRLIRKMLDHNKLLLADIKRLKLKLRIKK